MARIIRPTWAIRCVNSGCRKLFEVAMLDDQKQQEVNAKTKIIQEQDRTLELRLQRLDNERTQIKTEIDAVDKVINENIEKSYKTFSG